ncbi:hypothetical protein [Streptomyces sp. NPDC051921]|uniref:hypothetical protein n=1 Tax=Streptomyces sp. NPDC051921 TaxID=3155806 RepID=UPI00341EA4EC
MVDAAPHTTRDPRAEHPCPACGEPRHVHAHRHKVLGAWVPEWEVLPCRNPRCELYEPERAEDASAATEDAPGTAGSADGTAGGGSGDGPGDGRGTAGNEGAEATTAHVTGKNDETGRSPAPG